MKKAIFEFIKTNSDSWEISAMCRVLKVTRQGYYAWLSRGISAHDKYDEYLLEQIIGLWKKFREVYGAPKTNEELKKLDIRVSTKRVARIMREQGMRGACGVGLQKPSAAKTKPERGSANDHIKRKFSAEGPNETWFADITYVKTYQGWLYLAVVIDIYSRMIVGWAMGPRIDAQLVDDALRMALTRRKPAGDKLIHHSDHGSQYRSLLLGKTMKEHGITPSMGAISSPWDNAPTESFMSIIKRECIHRKTFETKEQAMLEIFDYIETFCNRLRSHSRWTILVL